jgi:hypothetical protein
MLSTKIGKCEHCGAEMSITRRTKTFCSDKCRKAASRESASGRRAEDGRLVEIMALLRLLGRIWPVYPWDTSPAVYALLVRRNLALAEVNLKLRELDADPITEADLVRAMRRKAIADYGDQLVAELVAEFYRARKDRRIGRKSANTLGGGYTPSDDAKLER